jgi:hypothetical protein
MVSGALSAAPAAAATGVIHVHSDYSHDGRDSLERLRDFALERGLGFVGLTDHAEDLDPAVFAAYLERCRLLSDERMALIPGLEYRFEGRRGLHLLALGLRQWIEPRTPAEFIEQAREAASFTVWAHPVLCRYRVPEAVLQGIDAIEVWNAAYNTRYLPDPRAIRLLHALRTTRPEVVGTVGLDQHDSRNDRQTRTHLHHAGADPLRELKAGRFTSSGRTMRFDAWVRWHPIRLAALSTARRAFDTVERTQEHLARTRMARSGSGA